MTGLSAVAAARPVRRAVARQAAPSPVAVGGGCRFRISSAFFRCSGVSIESSSRRVRAMIESSRGCTSLRTA